MALALKGALLDIDGTLVLSDDAHARAMVDALEEAGYHATFDQIRPLIGMGGSWVMQKVFPSMPEETAKKLSDKATEIFLHRYAPSVQPAPGARAFVECVQHKGLKVAVATSGKQQEVETLLKIAGVADLIHHQTNASDVKAPKPAPNVVESAREQLGFPPDEVVMIGDTPYDIESAEGAHVATIAVRTGGWSDQDLRGAIAIYDDLQAIVQHYDSSPLAHWAEALRQEKETAPHLGQS